MMYDREPADSDWTMVDTWILTLAVLSFLLCVACGVMGMIA